jgi:phosphoglycerate dehydrogenase-like enzyme
MRIKLACSVALILAVAAGAQTKRFKILMAEWPPEVIAELHAAVPEADIVTPTTKEQWLTEIADADAMYGHVRPELLRAAKKLRWVQSTSAGVEGHIAAGIASTNIVLTNARGIASPNIADHAFALLLTLTRCINEVERDRGKDNPKRMDYHPIELKGKTAVIVGVGSIGTEIAVRASAFGMRVVGVDHKDLPSQPYLAKLVRPDRLDTVLPEADVVFVSAPLTQETRGMFNRARFQLMKRGAYFIAVSRGKLTDTAALMEALDSKQLAGAGLDVTDPEPLPASHPLWKFPNAIITPHLAGTSDNAARRRIELMKENMRRFRDGEPLLNVVDKQKGY